jgi:hypothetical protein
MYVSLAHRENTWLDYKQRLKRAQRKESNKNWGTRGDVEAR